MTHYKNSLLNNSGEGHIDTGIKIIIGIVIGALILGGLYALFDTLVMPKINTKVQGMMQYGENSPSYRYGATLSSLQYSYDGSTWMNADIPDIGKNAIKTDLQSDRVRSNRALPLSAVRAIHRTHSGTVFVLRSPVCLHVRPDNPYGGRFRMDHGVRTRHFKYTHYWADLHACRGAVRIHSADGFGVDPASQDAWRC